MLTLKLAVYNNCVLVDDFCMDITYPDGMMIGYELEFCSLVPIPRSISSPLDTWFRLGTDTSLQPNTQEAEMYEIRSREPLTVVSVDVIKLMLDQLNLVDSYIEDERDPAVTGPTRVASTYYTNYVSGFTFDTSTTASMYQMPEWATAAASTTRASGSYIVVDFPIGGPDTQPAQENEPARKNVKKAIFTTRRCGMHIHISWSNKRLAHILFGRLAEVLTQKVKPFDERRQFCCPDFQSFRGSRYSALRWVDMSSGHFEVRIFNGTMKLRGIVQNLKMIRNEALYVARASQAAVRTQSAKSFEDLGCPVI